MSNKKNETIKKTSNYGIDKIKTFFNKLKNIVIKFLKKHWDILLINLIVFILTVFIESQYIYNLKFLGWVFNALVFIVVPTLIISLKRNIKTKDILIGIPFLYLLFLIFLDYCTIRELYGINKVYHDTFPNYIDALMVVFIFIFIEYITVILINKLKKKIYKDNKKVETKKKIKK